MPKVSLSEAARLTGKARVTIHRHIDKGKLTKEIDGTGSPVLDVAELERVYGALKQPNLSLTVPEIQPETVNNDNLLQRELELLREERERERGQFINQIDDLRHRLDAEAEARRIEGEERRKLTAILTDQREKPAAEPEQARKGLRGFLQRVLHPTP
jgi:hypothetical protein